MTPNACEDVRVETVSSTGCCTVPPNRGPSNVNVSPLLYPEPPSRTTSTVRVPTLSETNLIEAPKPAPVVVEGATSNVLDTVYDDGV